VPAYDALVLTGAVLFTFVVPIAYLLGWSVFDSRHMGLLAALSVTVLEFFSYHALYFYPQALASVFILGVLYLNSRLRYAADERTFRRLSVFVVALVTTPASSAAVAVFRGVTAHLRRSDVGRRPAQRRRRRVRGWLVNAGMW